MNGDLEMKLDAFEEMCEIIGSDATDDQVERLTSFALDAFGSARYRWVAEVALEHGITALYTEFTMRAGESGV